MNKITTALLLLVSSWADAQTISYEQWKSDSKTNIRLLPEYGNVPKTKEQKEADEEFIQASLKQDGTHQKASQHLIDLGFDYLYKGDVKIAMYRFNQAWLLDPKNENAYWGFGSIYFTFQDFPNAMKQYEKGLSINPKSSNILTDKATILMAQFNSNGNKSDLLSAIELFRNSYSIDSKNQNTLIKLSACYFFNNDCSNARKYYNECLKLGGNPITQEYKDALFKKCGNK